MVLEHEELKQRLKWLVNLRWGGILGVFIATHVVREIAGLSFSLIPAYVILGAAALFNLAYRWRLVYPRENLLHLALVQIIVDQLILAFAVYFSGGCDSPFIYFFMFHVVISGIMLPWRFSFVFAGSAVLLPALVLGLKHLGILPHFGIFKNEPVLFADPVVIGSYGAAFIATVFLTAYFVTYLSKRLNEKNEEVVRLYTLSERLRSSIRLQDVIEIIERELRGFTRATSSVFLPLNRERRVLTLSSGSQELQVPLIDRNSFTGAVMKGVVQVIDRRVAASDYDVEVLDVMGIKKALILPVMAASLRPCYDYFQCSDMQCLAYGKREGVRCWQLAGTHCKGAILPNYLEKLEACLGCELFTPVGVYVLGLQQDYLPFDGVNTDASLRLLDAAGLAVSNALLYEKTMQLSKTDGLTGLRNHREFKESLDAEFLRAKQYDGNFCLVLLDIDYFKQYNDTHGHPQGDVLLRKMAELLKDSVKETDFVARYGGEEFAILLLETSKQQGVEIAERVRCAIDACRFPKEETQPGGKVTASVGLSSYPEDGSSAMAILQAADAALYHAKRSGKNRVVAAGAPGGMIVQ